MKDDYIDQRLLKIHPSHIALSTPIALKTLSSAVLGDGFGYYHHFVNRQVSLDYRMENHKEDMRNFIHSVGFTADHTLGMMTAVDISTAAYKLYDYHGLSIFTVVTAGLGNAVDSSRALDTSPSNQIGTINTWLFINHPISPAAYIQAIVTATEAKTKVLSDLQIIDPLSHTIATGTSTDSILVAAPTNGKEIDYAGTATPLGKLIGKAIYEETKQAIYNTRK